MDKEIMNALKKIKNICSYSHCSECPFGNDKKDCSIQAPPENWKLNEPMDIYRYFK